MHRFDLTYGVSKNLVEEIRIKTGFDLSGYSHSFIKRQLGGFMDKNKLDAPMDLLDYLAQGPEKKIHFLDSVLPQKTELFRDPDLWQHLVNEIIEKDLKGKPISILELNSSTADESYTFGYISQKKNLNNVKFTSSFFLEKRIEYLSKGEFSEKKLESGSLNLKTYNGEDLDKIITNSSEKTFKVDQSLVEGFEKIKCNILNERPNEKYDIVLCRNLLCYLNERKEKSIHKNLADITKTGGYLVLGVQEELLNSVFKRAFKLVHDDLKIYKKVD